MNASVKTRQPGFIVFVCGMIVSGLILRGVDWLFEHDINIMGWYVKFIIPAGALIVGLGSGLGYALASRFMNAKLSKGFLWGMILAGLVDYVAAQYVTYSNLLERFHATEGQYSFVHYLKDICEHMTFTSSSSDDKGSPLGVWGYAFKLLEMGGFTFGYLIPSLAVASKPYCGSCQLYLKKHQTAFLNSAVQKSVFKKMKKADRAVAVQNAVSDVAGRCQILTDQIKEASFPDTEAALDAQHKASDKNALARVMLNLSKCPTCDAHHLNATLFHLTADKKAANGNLVKLDKTKPVLAEATA